ncbi:plasma membrane zinc ion transporter [Blastomyces gilchristii SLH14081]|uniref:Plasma membrane zinc ion transporter n=1 Tax=Blastomyces gilchristii (strain SLH14081) TaxID=559298 RepID=A0A179UBQ3_BLAGS|nr:plasma membrane zinc ion transporter [Blastomyces gilchristii SLH14081]OAT04441.1 plasma membrane zinc ion transporter [Blastomyces gilchristii SLH14081]
MLAAGDRGDGKGPGVSIGGPSLTNIPLAILRAELERRGYVGIDTRAGDDSADGNAPDGSTCGSGERTGTYNTPLHVAALVLILVLSTFACSFPIIARRFPRLPIPRHFLFLSRHFGTGVLIATAFVHLLPTAFISLTHPCLPRFWNKGYPATAGLVAMVAVMIVVTIEMFFALRGAKHVHGSEYDTLIDEGPQYHETSSMPLVNGDSRGGVHLGKIRSTPHPHEDSPSNPGSSSPHGLALEEGSSEPMLPKTRGSETQAGDDEDLDLEELDPFPDTSSTYNESRSHHYPRHNHNHHHPSSQTISAHAAQKQLLQCLLLEAGILFHSVFIGMALSVATGTSFLVLLVAISFHQTFEGFALGARIASLIPALFPASSPKPWLMAFAYGATTPIGQAIGLGLHNLYDPASTAGLLMVGMTNAFSSGLLLFAGLVELLAEDFLSDKSYETLRGRSRVEACMAAAAGALLMALVGAFA